MSHEVVLSQVAENIDILGEMVESAQRIAQSHPACAAPAQALIDAATAAVNHSMQLLSLPVGDYGNVVTVTDAAWAESQEHGSRVVNLERELMRCYGSAQLEGGLSIGAKVALGLGAVGAVGGLLWLTTRGRR